MPYQCLPDRGNRVSASMQEKGVNIVAVFTPDNWTCALTTLRLAGPIRASGMQLLEGNDGEVIFPERVSQADVVVIQRNFPGRTRLYENVINQAHTEGKPVIFEIDDLLFELPTNHPDKGNHYYEDALVPMLHAVVEANGVTVSTPQLRDFFKDFNPNIRVLPNYLNDVAWPFHTPPTHSVATPECPVVIAYMGGASHQADLEEVAPALRAIGQYYRDRVMLYFCGIMPPQELIGASDMCPIRWLAPNVADYARFATMLAGIGAHLFIAPLRNTTFNRGKSPIKFFEYSALGVPGVYSDVTPYSNVVIHGETGLLARDVDQWQQQLGELIENPAMRQRIGANAQQSVRQNWSLTEHAQEWRDAYQELAAVDPSPQAKITSHAIRQVQAWQQDRIEVALANMAAQEHAGDERRGAGLVQIAAGIRDLQNRFAKHDQAVTQLMGTIDSLRSQISLRNQDVERLTQMTSNLQMQLDWRDRHATQLVERTVQLQSLIDQRNMYIASLVSNAQYQNELIKGLVNGRVMRTLLGGQRWIRSLFNPGGARHAGEITIPAIPTMPPLAPGASDTLSGLNEAAAVDTFKLLLTRQFKEVLTNFFATGDKLTLHTSANPLLSIILPLHNHAELTLQCLRSIQANTQEASEVIVVDDASSDDTVRLLEHIRGAVIIRNEENLGYLRSCNLAAGQAKGEYILFLNSDVQLLPGSIDSALRTIRQSNSIGAVGAKIVLLDGTLQEAGSIIWDDGSCMGYGRGDSPTAPPYMFSRDVDFCSGAFLLTPRPLFEQVGGLDERFAPAYYEDSDYCLTLQDRGKRVVYDPNAIVLHYEMASHTQDKAVELQEHNRRLMVDKHQNDLRLRYQPSLTNVLLARIAPHSARNRKRVLYIDDQVPYRSLGSGFPRSMEILVSLVEAGHQVCFYPASVPSGDWESVYQSVPNTVEVAFGYGPQGMARFFADRQNYFHAIVISRPHNAKVFRTVLEGHPDWFTNTRIVYDAEAIFALRDAEQRRLRGEVLPAQELQTAIREETSLAFCASAITCVTEEERKHFMAVGHKEVYVLGHAVEPKPTQRSFDERGGILFVGAIYADDSPNADAVYWFISSILPLIRQQLGTNVTLTVAGTNDSPKVRQLDGVGVCFTGRLPDLTALYDNARIFVAPTRFAAGLPMKIHEAAAYGVPVVCTPLLARQLGWQDKVDVAVGDSPEAFAEQCIQLYQDRTLWQTLRANALKRVEKECSTMAFRAVVKNIIDNEFCSVGC